METIYKKITSTLIQKDYYISLEETEDHEKDGLPVFSPSDVRLLNLYKDKLKNNKEALNRVYIHKALSGGPIGKVLKDALKECKEEIHELPAGLDPMTQTYLSNIYKIFGRKCISGKRDE